MFLKLCIMCLIILCTLTIDKKWLTFVWLMIKGEKNTQIVYKNYVCLGGVRERKHTGNISYEYFLNFFHLLQWFDIIINVEITYPQGFNGFIKKSLMCL